MVSTFVGRERELTWLASRLTHERDDGRAVLLLGEAGVGKTRLVSEAIPRDRIAVSISFPGARYASPGFGLRRLVEIGGPEAAELDAELAEDRPSPVSLKLAALCRAADAVLRGQAPGVVVLDDLQCADELTLTWLSQTAELLRTTPVKLVLVVRTPDEPPDSVSAALEPLWRRRRIEMLRVRPLDTEAVGEMAAAFGAPTHADFLASLHARTDGLPLAVEEMLRHMAGSAPPEQWVTVMDDLPVPALLRILVRDQADALDDDARALLGLVALAPQPAAEPLLRAVMGLSRARFDAAVGRACESGLVESRAHGCLAYRHHLQREAMQEELPLAERRNAHRRIADALTTLEDPAAGEVAAQLIEAGAIDEALEWLERAADEAALGHDHATALGQLDEALALCPAAAGDRCVRLAEKAGLAAEHSQQPERGLELVDRGLNRAVSPGQRGRLLLRRAGLLSHREALVETLREAAAAFAHAGDDIGRARSLARLALPDDHLLSVEERLRLGGEALELATAAGDPLVIAFCEGNLAAVQINTGDVGAFDRWERAVAAAESGSGPEWTSESLRNQYNWTYDALAHGSYEVAARVIERALTMASGSVPLWERSFRTSNTILLWRLGRWDEALAESRQVRDLPDGDLAMVAAVRAAIDFEREARPHLEPLRHAIEVLSAFGPSAYAPALAIAVRIRAARREPRPARGVVALAESIAASGARIGWDDALPATAAADRATYDRLLNIIGDLRPAGPRGEASLLLASAINHDEGPERVDCFLEAARRYEAIGDPFSRAQALEGAGLAGANPRANLPAAAELYACLGARRSLRSLLRRKPQLRSLDPFRTVPESLAPPDRGLTPREREVAELAARAYTSAMIAERLNLSTRTVEKHLERAKHKLGAKRKSDLVRILSDEVAD